MVKGLKKLGDKYTMRGSLAVNVGNIEVQLFDGRFDTAYRIETLQIIAGTPTEGNEFTLIVSTEPQADITTFDFSDQTQVAWATFYTPIAVRWGETMIVDPNNLIVQDLFLSLRGSADDTFCNYIMTLQKYEISEWKGALTMVRNRSQGSPVVL